MAKQVNPASKSTSTDGSGTSVTDTEVLFQLLVTSPRLLFSSKTFENSIADVPGASATKLTVASGPLPLMPGTPPMSVSLKNVNVPAVLSI